MKMNMKKKYNMKAYGVIGQYGMTMASRLEHMAQREARRLKKLGFSPVIIPVRIIYELEKRAK